MLYFVHAAMRRQSRLLVAGIIVSAVGLVTALVLSIATLVREDSVVAAADPSGSRAGPLLGYHFLAALPDEEGEFFTDLINGLTASAARHGVSVEVQRPFSSSVEDGGIAELLRIARLADVDGVAVYVTDEERLTPLIDRLELSRIPVVTVESDAPGSRRSAFVGTNSATMGQEVGELITELYPQGARVGLIRSIYFSDAASQWNVIYYSILATLSAGDNHSIVNVAHSSRGVLTAEEVTRETLYLHPEANTLFSTSVVDTLAAAQAVAEFAEPGSVRIVGYGDNPRIREALAQGQIAATVVRNPQRIADEAVKALIDLREGRYVPSSVYVESEIRRQ